MQVLVVPRNYNKSWRPRFLFMTLCLEYYARSDLRDKLVCQLFTLKIHQAQGNMIETPFLNPTGNCTYTTIKTAHTELKHACIAAHIVRTHIEKKSALNF